MAVLTSIGFQNCLNSDRSGLSAGSNGNGGGMITPPNNIPDYRDIIMSTDNTCEVAASESFCPIHTFYASSSGVTEKQKIKISLATKPLGGEFSPYSNNAFMCFETNKQNTIEITHSERNDLSWLTLGNTYKFTAFKVENCSDPVSQENEMKSVTITPFKVDGGDGDNNNGQYAVHASSSGECIGSSDATLYFNAGETGVARYCATGFTSTGFWGTAVIGRVSCESLEGKYVNIAARTGDDGWEHINGLWVGELSISFVNELTITSCLKPSEDSEYFVRSVTTFLRN